MILTNFYTAFFEFNTQVVHLKPQRDEHMDKVDFAANMRLIIICSQVAIFVFHIKILYYMESICIYKIHIKRNNLKWSN